ncbi:MAG: flagellar basal body P-ring formation chaperone FlgA [Burkholderiales bacterium]
MKYKSHLKRIADALSIVAATLFMGQSTYAQMPPRQDHTTIYRGIDHFLRNQAAGSPNKISTTITPVDPRVSLSVCPAMDYFLPAGARLWGQTAVGVRCGGDTPWSIFVTVHVTVSGSYLVLARAVPQGHTLTDADIALQSGDLTQLPQGTLSDPALAVGKIVAGALAAGQPLIKESLRAPVVVQQGQSVLLQSSGQGFRVTAEGKALNNARDGQVTQVRTASGQTVSGIARVSGIVEVRQ